jgi:hypothetical protein
MTNRKQLMCFATFTALVALSGLARADDYSYTVDEVKFQERVSEPMTCAQATQFAWFKHELELSDGGTDNTVPVPAECQRDVIAQGSDAGENE